MCVCLCVSMYVCMIVGVCVYVFLYICFIMYMHCSACARTYKDVCEFACMYVYRYIHTHKAIRRNLHTYMYIETYIYADMYMYIYISMYVYIHIYMCIYLHTCTYTCVCICILIHSYIHIPWPRPRCPAATWRSTMKTSGTSCSPEAGLPGQTSLPGVFRGANNMT